MAPRPILKTTPETDSLASWLSNALPFATCSQMLNSPHVHFPPTPAMTTTEITHSSNTYDRAPITVSPNTCALPERGERVLSSRDHHPKTKRRSTSGLIESYFHPRAFEVCEPETLDEHCDIGGPPSLIPDVCSESDDSDICGSPDYLSPIPHLLAPVARDTTYPNINLAAPHLPLQDKENGVQAFLQYYPPCQVKTSRQQAKCKNKSRSKSSVRLPAYQPNSTFKDLSLEGCLGGF